MVAPGSPRRRFGGTGRHRDDRAAGQDRDAEPDGGQPRRRDFHRRLQARRTAPSELSDLAMIDHGSHYGFVENGVVLSKLQPGLATVVVFDDGSVDLETWTRQRTTPTLPRIRYARQNGVAHPGARRAGRRRAVPGSRVRSWGPGNWSGSADKKLRTLRAGLCLQESGGEAVPRLRLLLERHALLHGARVPGLRLPLRDAAGHERARAHLHGRLSRQGSQLLTQHLIDGMERRRRVQGRPAAAPLRQRRRQPGLLLSAAARPLR